MDIDKDYWQGKEPKTTKELVDQINKALLAARQWLGAANISSEDNAMIYAQLFWLEELIKLSSIKIKK